MRERRAAMCRLRRGLRAVMATGAKLILHDVVVELELLQKDRRVQVHEKEFSRPLLLRPHSLQRPQRLNATLQPLEGKR